MARISEMNKLKIIEQAEMSVRKAIEIKAYNSHYGIDWNNKEIQQIGLNDCTYGVLQMRRQTGKASRCVFEIMKMGKDIETAIQEMKNNFKIEFKLK